MRRRPQWSYMHFQLINCSYALLLYFRFAEFGASATLIEPATAFLSEFRRGQV